MAYVTVTKLDDGTEKVDIHERRPSWVVIEQASNMVKINLPRMPAVKAPIKIKQIAAIIIP